MHFPGVLSSIFNLMVNVLKAKMHPSLMLSVFFLFPVGRFFNMEIKFLQFDILPAFVDLPELSSCTAPFNSDEGVPFFSGISGRRKSRRRTGRLVTVNNQKIALLKYKGTVHALDEMCPHMGE